jgi:hypothetical protein
MVINRSGNGVNALFQLAARNRVSLFSHAAEFFMQ